MKQDQHDVMCLCCQSLFPVHTIDRFLELTTEDQSYKNVWVHVRPAFC